VALPCLVFQACFLLLLLILENVHIFIVADIKTLSIDSPLLGSTFIFREKSLFSESIFNSLKYGKELAY
ncbi:hypothetical protein SAMN05421801_1341, partial [Streptococcus equi]